MSGDAMPTRASKALIILGLGVLALLVLGFCHAMSPDPFTLPGDNLIYFLPFIRSHAGSLLDGHLLRMEWGVGAGWSPFESAAVGLLYPLNHLSLGIARILGDELKLLEVSAFLHIWLTGALTFGLAPRRVRLRDRLLLAILLMIQPAPLLLGRNWHIYLQGYPWFIALGLTVWRSLEGGLSTAQRRAAWAGFGLMTFLCAHPQIYILGILLLLAWMLAESPNRRGLLLALEAGACQLPLAIPLLYIKHLSGAATANMMAGRASGDLFLAFGQSLRTVLQGMLLGNLPQDTGFKLWSAVSGSGAGMFFCPAYLVALALVLRRRRWAVAVLLIFGILVMGISTFPWLKVLAKGPLAGFRWTWKLSMLLGPLSLIILARHWQSRWGTLSFRTFAGTALATVTLVVLGLGQGFDLLPATRTLEGRGVGALVAETRACLESAGLPRGSRVVVVGESGMVEPLPLPILGCMGAAPLLSGYETPCSYEPLEPQAVALLHGGLTVPWRAPIPALGYGLDPQGTEARLRALGVIGLITRFPTLFPAEGTTTYKDATGKTTWVRRLAPLPAGTYPYATLGEARLPLARLPGGRLAATLPPGQPPAAGMNLALVPSRPTTWTPAPGHAWVASPVWTLSGWIWAEGLALAALGLLVWFWPVAWEPGARRGVPPGGKPPLV